VAVGRRDPGAGRALDAVPRLPAAATAVVRRGVGARLGTQQGSRVALPALVLLKWPALVTLGVTLLRLAGERLGWSEDWFSRLPGGGLSPVGITWLVPFVGLYCGWLLQRRGARPPALGLALGVPLGVLVAAPAVPWLVNRLHETTWTLHLAAWGLASLFAALLAATAWPPLGRLLAAYALLARAPVVLLMALAMWRRWGTHYDAAPPGFPPMSVLERWLWTGLLPQATIWVAFTIAVGAVFGVLGWLAASRLSR
jgi:hypothetical protein